MQSTQLITITIDLHGLALSFQTPDAPLAERFETVYGHLPQADTSPDVSIQWQIHPEPRAPLPPAKMTPLSQDKRISYYGADDLVSIRMPKYGLITVDLKHNRLSGTVTRNCLEVYGAFEDVMMISLAPLYRRRGWFPLHAFAALAPSGKAVLITGAMGTGKTTTGLALLSAGWKLLSNDSPLLRVGERDAVEVLAYPGRLSAFDDSLARFAHLKHFIPTAAAASDAPPKRIFNAEEAFADPWASVGLAGGIFFPQVVSGLPQSKLIAVPPPQAILQLMPQAIEGWDKEAIAQNLRLLSKLAQQVPCYMLRLSPQVEQLPSLIAGGMDG